MTTSILMAGLGAQAAYAKQAVRNKLIEHNLYIAQHGEDILEIRDWKWGGSKTFGQR